MEIGTGEKQVIWTEYQKLDKNTQEWAKKIATADARPAHPEEYVEMAEQLLKTGKPVAMLRRVTLLHADEESHTEMDYSFLDFWGLILGRPRIGEIMFDPNTERHETNYGFTLIYADGMGFVVELWGMTGISRYEMFASTWSCYGDLDAEIEQLLNESNTLVYQTTKEKLGAV